MLQTEKGKIWPWVVILITTAAAVFLLRYQGRLWLCACGQFYLWVGDAWSENTSQHLLDPYSFTHVLHGFIFCWVITLLLPQLSRVRQLSLAVTAEAAWEVVENSALVINRYREATAAFGYNGDTIVNSLGDILMCSLGFVLARQIGFRRSLALFTAVEVVLLIWIRDSLLLNVVMLIHPMDWVKSWQSGLY